MSEPPSLTVAGDLSRIHQVITRALQVALQQSQFLATKELAVEDFGLQCYITALLQLLDSHHRIEDDLLFPHFRQKMPALPVAEMENQHRALVPLLEKLAGLLPELNQTHHATTVSWIAIAETLIKIEAMWEPHYQLEEAYLNEDNISQVIGPGEQEKLCHLYAETSQHHITVDYLVLPFILYNLPLQERQIMAKAFPTQITEKLIPGEWYLQWQVMSSYLLK